MSGLTCTVVPLGEYGLEENIAAVKEKMTARFGRDVIEKKFPPYDWLRLGLSMRQIKGATTVLDVGTGHGQLLNALARSRRFERVVGIEIEEHPLFATFYDGFEHYLMDAEEMTFGDEEFDTVVCLEVLEHQPDGKMERVLGQLRRVARKQLIVSVPFVEPEPLPKYSGGRFADHLQRFTAARIRQLFPTAEYTLLLKEPVTRVPWLIIDERATH